MTIVINDIVLKGMSVELTFGDGHKFFFGGDANVQIHTSEAALAFLKAMMYDPYKSNIPAKFVIDCIEDASKEAVQLFSHHLLLMNTLAHFERDPQQKLPETHPVEQAVLECLGLSSATS